MKDNEKQSTTRESLERYIESNKEELKEALDRKFICKGEKFYKFDIYSGEIEEKISCADREIGVFEFLEPSDAELWLEVYKYLDKVILEGLICTDAFASAVNIDLGDEAVFKTEGFSAITAESLYSMHERIERDKTDINTPKSIKYNTGGERDERNKLFSIFKRRKNQSETR